MSECNHDWTERETAATADALCPLCLRRSLAESEARAARAEEEAGRLRVALERIANSLNGAYMDPQITPGLRFVLVGLQKNARSALLPRAGGEGEK